MEPAQEIKLLTEVAELRSDVRHLQSDVIEIKSKVDKIETKFEARFDEIKDMIASAKLWAYGLYAGGGFALLYVFARSQKWF